MGYGDALMASGEARELRARAGKRVAVGDGAKVWWSPVFDHNPILASQADVQRGQEVVWLDSYPGHRPYIDYEATYEAAVKLDPSLKGDRRRAIKKGMRWVFRPYKPIPGEIHFTDAERGRARRVSGDYVVIEPHV